MLLQDDLTKMNHKHYNKKFMPYKLFFSSKTSERFFIDHTDSYIVTTGGFYSM